MRRVLLFLMCCIISGVIGYSIAYFFVPSPRHDMLLRFNLLPQMGDIGIPIPKGYFNQRNASHLFRKWDKPVSCIPPYQSDLIRPTKPDGQDI